jgi:hypothetical protein
MNKCAHVRGVHAVSALQAAETKLEQAASRYFISEPGKPWTVTKLLSQIKLILL